MTEVSFRLGFGTEEEKKKLELRSTQTDLKDARGIVYRGPVKMYSFFPEISVPVERRPVYSLMEDILGRPKELWISPEGFRSTESYGVPVKPGEPERDGMIVRGQGVSYKDTEEGIIRPWMIYSKGLREELINQGWTFIPHVEDLNKEEKKELGESDFTSFYKRPVNLKFLKTLMQMTALGEEKEEFALALRDLEEITNYMENAELVYSGGDGLFSGRQLLRGEAKLGDRKANLVLTDTMNLMRPKRAPRDNQYVSDSDKPNTCVRTVNFSVPVKEDGSWYSPREIPSWWTQEITRRVLGVAEDYAKKQEMTDVELKLKDNAFLLNLSNRKSYGEPVLEPNTQRLLEQSFDLRDCVATLIKEEFAEHREKENQIVSRRRAKIGLDDIAKKE